MAVSGIRILSKKFTPLLCRSSVARTGMALTKTNHMSTPFVDSLNGAKRPFSSSSIIEDRHLFRQSWYPWPPVPNGFIAHKRRNLTHKMKLGATSFQALGAPACPPVLPRDREELVI
ncbi:hypothetical protein OsI_24953 [Oryza sativa Indica Group]|uniref:Uncharacterized protein n=2 Tax=Oryza sativa TaxID=4530 RepID=B9FVK6_ORYSJ|nr:hypothetical protein OsI_24953 [Oryza sativa Indica Group]EEE66593.1 hypothetical protein OsJ_23147 [Oryza sativa Japonica Group]